MSVTTEVLLEAGGIVPLGSVVAKADTVDELRARSYRHPALPDRPVVRLVSSTLSDAEDLTMEFLGFDRPDRVTGVGLLRQRALGFPAWALVHDPANGHHALALVKEIERLSRIAKSRLPPAKDGFDSLGDQLARSVPHFLPTFYEQAGRAFLAADSPFYAAMMFGKAREAEKTFSLTVDEDRTHAVFLEFGLAGALSAKALSAHSRDLAIRCADPVAAFDRFRRLCSERILGGLPPYAAMPTDLRRLAKAAGLDPAAADRQVLADILTAPALQRAPEAFWTAYGVALAGLAADDPAVRGHLLSFMPFNVPGVPWLNLLETTGATAGLTARIGETPGGAESPDGPAGWLSRFARRYLQGSSPGRITGLLLLAERMAPRLIADGVPVHLIEGWNGDLELLDLCLAAGVPVADQPDSFCFYVSRLFPHNEPFEDRDLAAVAADPRFLTPLVRAVENYLPAVPTPDRVRQVVAVAGLRVAVGVWLDELAGTVAAQGLPTLDRQLDRVRKVATPEGLATNPDAVRRLAAHDLAPVLAATLRAGLLDEYEWPAFERAAIELLDLPMKDEQLVLTEQWPVLILRRGDIARVVGPDRVLLEHRLLIPANQPSYRPPTLRFVDGQLLVSWTTWKDRSAYWSGTPADVHTELPEDAFTQPGRSLPLPAGGRTSGGRPLHVGDRSEDNRGAVVTDGTAYWVHTREDSTMREFDPRTGEPGRVSMPAFFQAGAVDGEPIEVAYSMLRVAPEGAQASPYGAADGLVGWRTRVTPDHDHVGEGIDGRTFRYTADTRQALGGAGSHAVRFPGSDAVHGMRLTSGWGGEPISLCTADGRAIGVYHTARHSTDFAAGTAVIPPGDFWHHLRPRDLAGSAVLRGLPDGVVSALLAEAATLRPPVDEKQVPLADVVELVRRAVPELTNEALVKGVAGVVRYAAERVARLRGTAEVLSGTLSAAAAAPVDSDAGLVRDHDLLAALTGLVRYLYGSGTGAVRMVAAAGAALTASEPPEGTVLRPEGDRNWFSVLALVRAIMYRAVSPSVDPDRREALLALLTVFADSGLFRAGARLRQLSMNVELEPPPEKDTVVSIGECRVLVLSVKEVNDGQGKRTRVEGLDYSADGTFGALPGCQHVSEKILVDGTWDASVLTTFVATARERGAPPLRPDLAESLSRTAGISHAEATLLLAGLHLDGERAGWSPPDLGATGPAIAIAGRTWYWRGESFSRSLVESLVPADPTALWDTGPVLDEVIAWADRRGVRRPVPDDLIVMVDQYPAQHRIGTSELLHGLATPDTCQWLAGPDGGVGDQHALVALARTLPWLVYHLPPGEPIRANLPGIVDRLRTRIADPAFALPLAQLDREAIEDLTTEIGLTPKADGDLIRHGPLTYRAEHNHRPVNLHPGLLSGPDDPVLSLLRARGDNYNEHAASALGVVLDGSLARLVVPGSGDHPQQDPTRSVPHLVAEAAERLGIGPDAAALYLQLLALPDPTDRNVAAWTGWKPARLKKARLELVAAGTLVVEAKRSRAGRSLFLPCGWLALKAPHLPVETWKAPLLTMDEQGNPTIDVIVPRTSVPRSFEQAWARVCAGDVPKFDELVTERQKRR
ncbi:hypothetical protein [Micromonospora sp. NPDC004704]